MTSTFCRASFAQSHFKTKRALQNYTVLWSFAFALWPDLVALDL
jgi:hypothetical protein